MIAVVLLGSDEEEEVELTVDMTRMMKRARPGKPPVPGIVHGVGLEGSSSLRGIRFVTASCLEAKVGFWIADQPGSVAAVVWDPRAEDFTLFTDPESHECTAVRDMIARGMLPSCRRPEPSEEAAWAALSSHVDQAVLRRAGIPPGTKVVAGGAPAADVDERKSKSAVVPRFGDSWGRVAAWTELSPPRGELAKMTAAQRTKFGHDGSARLEWVLEESGMTCSEIVGELQLAFILFVLLASQEALEHWKELSAMLCACQEPAVTAHPRLFADFLDASAAQFSSCDLAELLAVTPEAGGRPFVESCFCGLFETLSSCSSTAPAFLMDAISRFRRSMTDRCGFDPAQPSLFDEDAPTVVEEEVEEEEEGRKKVLACDGPRQQPSTQHSKKVTEIESAIDSTSKHQHLSLKPPPGPLSFSFDDDDS